MEIDRLAIHKLVEWKGSGDRRPLVIQGARQIGKTWLMKRFGKQNYRHVAYFNFDASLELSKEFARTKDPRRIVYIYISASKIPR